MRQHAGYLLDTNIISETRKRQAEQRILRFLAEAAPTTLFLSVLTVGELRKGVAGRRVTDANGAESLSIWVNELEDSFGERILNVDATIARLWGELSAGRTRPVIDTLLAATAIAHSLTLVTRNLKDFDGLSVSLLNPWDAIPNS